VWKRIINRNMGEERKWRTERRKRKRNQVEDIGYQQGFPSKIIYQVFKKEKESERLPLAANCGLTQFGNQIGNSRARGKEKRTPKVYAIINPKTSRRK